jgi:hypothetical protein
MSSLNFDEARDYFKTKGFYSIAHVVVKHHMRKDFEDYAVTRDHFYILPLGRDFLHVALVEHEYGKDGVGVLIRYTCAGDDLLYGLAIKYKSGGSNDNSIDIAELDKLIIYEDLRENDRYVRQRFRHGRVKAKVRALFVMLKDTWKNAWFL